MEQKRIKTENSLHQIQEFGIAEYDDHIVLKAFLSSNIKNIEIPDTIACKSVTSIGDACFFNCMDIKTVSFPQTIESVGAQAFALCKGLMELILPDSVTKIGPRAFRDCRGLKKVILPKSLKRLETGLFSFCYLHDPEIILPERLEVIESGAFWCAGTFDLVIPDSVKEIGVGAFYWGPHPITSFPENKGWFLEWPYGERVECLGETETITDIQYLENNCQLHVVTNGSGERKFFYPCDYLDNLIIFAEKNNQQRIKNKIELDWRTERKLAETYMVRDAWKRGLIASR